MNPSNNWGAQGPWGSSHGHYPVGPSGHIANITAPSATASVIDSILPLVTPLPGSGNIHLPMLLGRHAIEIPANPIPKSVVDPADKVGRGFARVFELAGQYAISKMATAPLSGHTQATQHPALDEIGVRVNPLNFHRKDPAWVRQHIIGAAPSEEAARQMMDNYQARVFLSARILARFLWNNILKKTCFNPLAQAPWSKPTTQNIARAAAAVDDDSVGPATKYNHLITIKTNLGRLRANITPDPWGPPSSSPPTMQDLHRYAAWFTQKADRNRLVTPGITNQRGDEFWPMAVAFFPEKRSADWKDLRELMMTAHMLVFDMYDDTTNTAADYNFLWPRNAADFDEKTMVARGNLRDNYAYFPGYAAGDLEGAKVVFAISPAVEMKEYEGRVNQRSNQMEGTGRKRTEVIVKAQVLVRV